MISGVSPPHDEVLLFRQKDPKPIPPCRCPSGPLRGSPRPAAAELAPAQTVLAKKVEFGSAAKPRPTQLADA
jgi:hypothetical protein